MTERRLNVRVSEEMLQQVKIECVKINVTVSDLVRDLLSEWLEQRLAMRKSELANSE
jgi:predicted DNA binding CopG/RHH family protein